jgi:hypothetical protein
MLQPIETSQVKRVEGALPRCVRPAGAPSIILQLLYHRKSQLQDKYFQRSQKVTMLIITYNRQSGM